jgi:hypothetical protein
MNAERKGPDDPRPPRVAPACRPFVRAALAGDHLLGRGAAPDEGTRAHLASCPDCRERAAARDRLADLLRQRPELPTNALAGAGRDPLLEAVHERVIDRAAESALGRMLGAAPVEALADGAAWPEGLVASDLVRRAMTPPEPASALAWSRVRESILVGVASRSMRRLRRRWAVGLAAAVLLAAAGLLLGRGSEEAPTIVFRDIGTMPGVDFAVVRYGAVR